MKSFQCETEIGASAQDVWTALTNAPRYTSWNSTVERVEGSIADGSRVTVYAKISPGRAFPLTVGAWDAPRRMTWSGGMPLGLFKGVREFLIESAGSGKVRFRMRETYSGLLASLITKSIPDLQPAFVQFAADLKAHVEAGLLR